MKAIVKILALGAIAASTTILAHATTINGSISGNDANASYNNTSGLLSFGTGPTDARVSGTPTGFGGYFVDLQPMQFYADTTAGSGGYYFYSPTAGMTLTISGSTATSGGVKVFSVANGGETLEFYVTSDTTAYNPSDNSSVVINGTGYFLEYGVNNSYTATASTFHLSGTSPATSTFSFGGSAATNPTPEPNSLVLLGTGLMSAAGMAFRKRRSIA